MCVLVVCEVLDVITSSSRKAAKPPTTAHAVPLPPDPSGGGFGVVCVLVV